MEADETKFKQKTDTRIFPALITLESIFTRRSRLRIHEVDHLGSRFPICHELLVPRHTAAYIEKTSRILWPIAMSSQRRMASIYLSLRVLQSRWTAHALIALGRSSRGRSFICRVRKNRLAAASLNRLLGFRGTFASLEEATACVANYVPTGHGDPNEHVLQVTKAETTRESDYPLLFFLFPLRSELRTVFDLGGGIGNLFYVLDRQLQFSNELVWKIHDLPIKKQPALAFAELKNETRVTFTDDFSSASGSDLFVVVGALHYFEQSLADLLGPLDKRPKHVILNRTPLSHGPDIITVQDYGNWVFACKLHSVTKLVSGMQGLGYRLVASWPVHERKLDVPLHPEYTEPYYGFYFRLHDEIEPDEI